MNPVKRVLVAVPARNEARFISDTLQSLMPAAETWPFEWHLVVLDGFSTDSTVSKVLAFASSSGHADRISVVSNPKQSQPAAVNMAAFELSGDCDVLVQCDAHGTYPPDFVANVCAEIEKTGADSVVVSMDSRSHDGRWFSRAAAAAQNSRLGNGGSAHRNAAASRFVDHGHHAGFLLSSFREIGGYDETFRANFDGEFDFRMAKAGKRVWLDGADVFTYFVRDDIRALARQYYGHGSGRARTVLRHRVIKLRQILPVFIFGGNALCLAVSPWIPAALALPALYAAACMTYGAFLSGAKGAERLAGLPAMIAHNAWGSGFLVSAAKAMTARKESRPRNHVTDIA